MNIRRRTVILSLIFLITLLSVGFSAVAVTKEPTESSSTPPQQSGYILKEYNGNLSIFKSGEDTPLETLDVMVDTLPERDITRLKAGIFCQSYSEAMLLAEDYE